jgi:2'-5' RNA ligase
MSGHPITNAHQLEALYRRKGIDLDTLGVVMLDTRPTRRLTLAIPALDERDLYVSKHASRHWIKGEVASGDVSHTTLLYGLLPGTTQADVEEVLAGWESPNYLWASSIDSFPSPYTDDDARYVCIVAKLGAAENPALDDAHRRLSFLPHIDTHATYQPHVTLAYVREEAAEKWLRELRTWNARENLRFLVTFNKHPRGLNFGTEIAAASAAPSRTRAELIADTALTRVRYDGGDRKSNWLPLENQLTEDEFETYMSVYQAISVHGTGERAEVVQLVKTTVTLKQYGVPDRIGEFTTPTLPKQNKATS